ncbi:uncharacterized protein TEOVI_000726300 [Trypanosoma equiperdum]|uniref:Uncharacterized protein n=1 Tax=Trypanosoma equiperdum TaxID=5694 RepID=A0A1G4I9Z9_TRYEQ|nr:hypothetical protein, conserved [Trypanosoma equiperdum]
MHSVTVLSQPSSTVTTCARSTFTNVATVSASPPRSTALSGMCSLSSSSSLWNTDPPADDWKDIGDTIRGTHNLAGSPEQQIQQQPAVEGKCGGESVLCGVRKVLPFSVSCTAGGDVNGRQTNSRAKHSSALKPPLQASVSQATGRCDSSNHGVAPTKQSCPPEERAVGSSKDELNHGGIGDSGDNDSGFNKCHPPQLPPAVIFMSPLKTASGGNDINLTVVSSAPPPGAAEAAVRDGSNTVSSDDSLDEVGTHSGDSNRRLWSCANTPERPNSMEHVERVVGCVSEREDVTCVEADGQRKPAVSRSCATERRRRCLLRQIKLVDAEVARMEGVQRQNVFRIGSASGEALSREKAKLLELRNRYEAALHATTKKALEHRQPSSLSVSSAGGPSHFPSSFRSSLEHDGRQEGCPCKTVGRRLALKVSGCSAVPRRRGASVRKARAAKPPTLTTVTPVAVVDDNNTTGSAAAVGTDVNRCAERESLRSCCSNHIGKKPSRATAAIHVAEPARTYVDPYAPTEGGGSGSRAPRGQTRGASVDAERMAAFYLRNGRSRHLAEASTLKTAGGEGHGGKAMMERNPGTCASSSRCSRTREASKRPGNPKAAAVGPKRDGCSHRTASLCTRASSAVDYTPVCASNNGGCGDLNGNGRHRRGPVYHLCAPSVPNAAHVETWEPTCGDMTRPLVPSKTGTSLAFPRKESGQGPWQMPMEQRVSCNAPWGFATSSVPVSSSSSAARCCYSTGLGSSRAAPYDYRFARTPSYHHPPSIYEPTQPEAAPQVVHDEVKDAWRAPFGPSLHCGSLLPSGRDYFVSPALPKSDLMWRQLASRSYNNEQCDCSGMEHAAAVGGTIRDCSYGGCGDEALESGRRADLLVRIGKLLGGVERKC